MRNLGQYRVWLKGSRKNIWRCVYEQDGKHYIKWCGQMIEVIRGLNDYVTVEEY